MRMMKAGSAEARNALGSAVGSQNGQQFENRNGRMRRGPTRISFVPTQFRDIPGIDSVETAGQLRKLATFIDAPAAKRPAFVRLGCSVSHGLARVHNPPRSVWAVRVAEKVSVIARKGDPRSAWKWFGQLARPWNLECEFEARESVPKDDAQEKPLYYIAVVSVDTEHSCKDACNIIDVDDRSIISVNTRRVRDNTGQVEAVECLVCGAPGWWLSPKFDSLLIGVREAVGEIFAGLDGTCWVSSDRCETMPYNSWADLVLTERNRQEAPDAPSLLKAAARKQVLEKLIAVRGHAADGKACRTREFRVDLAIRKLDLRTARVEDFDKIARGIAADTRSYSPFAEARL